MSEVQQININKEKTKMLKRFSFLLLGFSAILILFSSVQSVQINEEEARILKAQKLLTWPVHPQQDEGGFFTEPTNFNLGLTFIPNVKVSDDPGSGSQNEPYIVVDQNGILYEGWNDNRFGNYHLGFSRSLDNGLTWSPNTFLNEPTFPSQGDPCLAVDNGGNVYYSILSFGNYSDVFITKSTDQGNTWGPNVLVSTNTPYTFEDREWFTVDGNNVYCTFTSFASNWYYSDIRFARSTDGGASFQPWFKINDNTNYSYRNSAVPRVGPGGVIYVAWGIDDRAGADGIYITKSTNGGVSFGPNIHVIDVQFSTYTPWRCYPLPTLGVDKVGGNVYIAWTDDRYGNPDILFVRSTDGGNTFSSPIRVNDIATGVQVMPWMEVDPYGIIHLVWYDTRSGGWNLDVYYASSSDGGLSFSPNVRVTDVATPGQSFIGDFIGIAVDEANAHVSWSDNRNQTQDIYYSRASIQPVTLTLTPDSTTLHRGGKLTYTATITNNTDQTQSFEGWTEVTMPSGEPYPGNPVVGPRPVTLAPNETKTKKVSHSIPINAPLGTYTYCGKVGDYPTSFWDEDCFTFTVTP